MAQFLRDLDPYDHPIVVHTFPGEHSRVYPGLLGDRSVLTGPSLQNHWFETHWRTIRWRVESARAGKPWVITNDEQGAGRGAPADRQGPHWHIKETRK